MLKVWNLLKKLFLQKEKQELQLKAQELENNQP
jgi:hypothetical protein